MRVNRRAALAALGAGAVLPQMASAARQAGGTFDHGVASGDPHSAGAVLWTRVTPADGTGSDAIPVRWHVTAGEGGKPVESGTAHARAARDFTVKVEPQGLKPGLEYRYWFELADGTRSPTGRFRTLARGHAEKVVLAVVSCQLYPGGFFTAYDDIARQESLDAVVHLGDYIYEYGADGYGAGIGQKLGRVVEPAHEIVTLADYRIRHAQYKRDASLQAAHARAAFICVWDDHETANDAWTGGGENHQPATEGDWSARKAAAMQAYFEWMPIRDPRGGDPWEAINRSFDFGDLASLMMVETRLLARSEQAGFKGETPGASQIAGVLAERNRADREMLGEPQRAWLEKELAASVAAGKRWQVLGNQVVMARVNGPDMAKLFGAEKAAAMIGTLDPATRAQVEASQVGFRAGLPYNLDAWDGYPAARERLYRSIRKTGATPLVLAGDSHAFWANELKDDAGAPVGVEFGTSAISSPSVGDAIPALPLGDLLEKVSPEVRFCDQRAKGYIRLTLTHEGAQGEYVAMSSIFEPKATARTIARVTVPAGGRTLQLERVQSKA
ncbi:alkaline phosphatase [Novosphingobium sp. FGD1]|uniref:Alkaline phosphatase n=1 Tax=Novosphingobium silvae TaxID=2692619 RepID=A0A7X4K5P3_9SPHN|nr:alkaline phosphatase [Novosphingobium silvae]